MLKRMLITAVAVIASVSTTSLAKEPVQPSGQVQGIHQKELLVTHESSNNIAALYELCKRDLKADSFSDTKCDVYFSGFLAAWKSAVIYIISEEGSSEARSGYRSFVEESLSKCESFFPNARSLAEDFVLSASVRLSISGNQSMSVGAGRFIWDMLLDCRGGSFRHRN